MIGQDQDEIRGGYNPRQSWSGAITQVNRFSKYNLSQFSLIKVNVWDFSIEKWDIENIAKCRSDAFGNVIRVSND